MVPSHRFATYFLPSCTGIYVSNNWYMQMMGPVDMKRKYKAKWALVTGAGTGIGKNHHAKLLFIL